MRGAPQPGTLMHACSHSLLLLQDAAEECAAAVPSRKRTTTLTSLIISGDQAAMNKAPAPQEAARGMKEEPVQVCTPPACSVGTLLCD